MKRFWNRTKKCNHKWVVLEKAKKEYVGNKWENVVIKCKKCERISIVDTHNNIVVGLPTRGL